MEIQVCIFKDGDHKVILVVQSTIIVVPVNSIVWCRFVRLLGTAKVLGPAELPPR